MDGSKRAKRGAGNLGKLISFRRSHILLRSDDCHSSVYVNLYWFVTMATTQVTHKPAQKLHSFCVFLHHSGNREKKIPPKWRNSEREKKKSLKCSSLCVCVISEEAHNIQMLFAYMRLCMLCLFFRWKRNIIIIEVYPNI